MQSYHIYSLPHELLASLTPRHLWNETIQDSAQSPPIDSLQSLPATNTGPRACNICLGISFTDVEEQRTHYRSDWHRYNVKTRINGGNSVTEAQFGQLVDGLEDSISGSESSSDEDSDTGASDAVAALITKRKPNDRRSPSPDAVRSAPRTALAWFHSPPSTQIGVYKTLFALKTDESAYLDALKDMQSPQPRGRRWALFMVAGGHFAGAVARVSQPGIDDEEEESGKKKKQKKPKPDVEFICHKTFHRYTTRRKQGGSQGLNDNAKGNAKSAGAQLRRYGEQSLRDDIRNLLTEWEDDLADCERVFIRASGTSRKTFMDYEGSQLTKSDDRLRTFPFPTRRPTQSELSRCLLELTRAKISFLSEEALKEQDEAYLASLPKPKVKPEPKTVIVEKPKPVKLSKEEEVLKEKWNRLLDMVSKGRLEALRAFWTRESDNLGGSNARIPEWAGEDAGRTLLQLAAQSGQEETTRWFLQEGQSNPTLPVVQTEVEPSSKTLTAYDVSKTKGVRDVFRRCAAEQPDLWDWFGAAHVPSALSKEMEDERDEKKKTRRKGLKDKVREREAKEKDKVQSRSPSPQPPPRVSAAADILGPRRLGGTAGATEGVAGLTPEMRAKVERERRARAAEARLKTLGSG